MKILMVCLGNICRSPIAEGIMQHKIRKNNLNWEVASCGTGSWHVGELADNGARKIMQKKNMDISQHRAKQFHYTFFNDYDLILAMDASNYRDLMLQAKDESEKNKVRIIMNLVYPEQNIGIPDPYYDHEKYTDVFNMLDAACDKVIELYSE